MNPNENLKDQDRQMVDREGQIETGGGGWYEIKVAGQLDEHWSEWMGGLAINHDDQRCTLLTGLIPDQAALHGILGQLRKLGLTLIWLKSAKYDK